MKERADQIPPTKNERQWAAVYGIRLVDPGFIYMIEDRGRYKIGRSVDRDSRLRAARTWLPDARVIGIKPFWDHGSIEARLHEGFACCWYDKEWFLPFDEGYQEIMEPGFAEFSDNDRFQNSIDFIYWFNSSSMAEFVAERALQGRSLRSFQAAESEVKKRSS